MADRRLAGRRAGALVPLFSIPSRESWGIGEISDLPIFAQWLRDAGLSVLQLLPVNEMSAGQTSPYSALTAMAIDPIYISLRDVPEFQAWGGESALDDEESDRLAEVRSSPFVDYRTVRDLKTRCLRDAFDTFMEDQWRGGSERASALRRYLEVESWWLDDYALFRALHRENEERYWIEWEAALRRREAHALRAARQRLERDILYYAWLQWIASEQWTAARAECPDVAIIGDFPFMVSGDSADVWVRQQQFRLDASVGVPPDAFSETGQDWGLPVYRWDVVAATGDEWLKSRARRSAALFDGFRIDHLVGFYRTFVREKKGSTCFVPADEPAQLRQGQRLMAVFRDSGAAVIAEDLGIVPDFVRESLEAMGVPGLKVLRWEREWDVEGHPFREPASYPRASVAMSGTHDTETLAEWWDAADADERVRAVKLEALVEAAITADETYSPRLRDALLKALFAAASDLILLPLQDIFGWTDRINTPAVVASHNWTWRLPWPVDTMRDDSDAMERAEFLERLGSRAGRIPHR
jgi:4-alpha-glucanotransferase